MIKNNVQLARAEARLGQIAEELASLREQYSPDDFEFWAGSLEDEAVKLRTEIQEYRLLTELSLSDAVSGILREPVLLENIGELLAKLRLASGMTQEEMAERLGWQQSNLSRFESETYSSQTIAKIIEFIGALGVYIHVVPSMNEKSSFVTYKPISLASSSLDQPELKLSTTDTLGQRPCFEISNTIDLGPRKVRSGKNLSQVKEAVT